MIGVRADFYGQLSTHAGLARAVGRQPDPARRDDRRRAASARSPSRRGWPGCGSSPASSTLVLRDVAGEPGALPLLSHALRATWERRDGRTLTVEGYRESGGVASAVAQTADTLVESRPRRPARARAQPLPAAHRARRGHRGHPPARATSTSSCPRAPSPDAVQALLDAARRRAARDARRGHGRGRPRGADPRVADAARLARRGPRGPPPAPPARATPPACGTPAAARRPTSTAAPGSRPRWSGRTRTPRDLNATERAFLDESRARRASATPSASGGPTAACAACSPAPGSSSSSRSSPGWSPSSSAATRATRRSRGRAACRRRRAQP